MRSLNEHTPTGAFSEGDKKVPKYAPKELLRMTQLEDYRVIVVEGRSDVVVYEQWLENRTPGGGGKYPKEIEFVEVDRIDFSSIANEHNLRGNRERVLAMATVAGAEKFNDLCGVIDRDLGYTGDQPSVLCTDYPAVESYSFNSDFFDFFNRLYLDNALPIGERVVAAMAPVLWQLFKFRELNPNDKNPIIYRGFSKIEDKGGDKQEEGLALLRAYSIELVAERDDQNIPPARDRHPSSEDSRKYAYGHDIVPLLQHAFTNSLKRSNFRGLKQLEKLIILALRTWDGVESENLYRELRAFAVEGVAGVESMREK